MLIIIVSSVVRELKKFHTKRHQSHHKMKHIYIANVKSFVCHSCKLGKQQVFTHRDLCTIWNAISEYMSRKGAPLNVQGKDNIRE